MDRLVEINIDQSQSRPLLEITTAVGVTRCLVDTGADIPVWCLPEDLFVLAFPKALKTDFGTYISGFGHGSTYADIWKIPRIILSDRKGRDEFTIHNVLVAVAPKTMISFAFIMSASMFTTTDYSVINRASKRYMSVAFERDCYCVPRLALSDNAKSPDKKQIISGIDVFMQGE